MRINTRSIFFRTALIYLFLTVLNISIFVLIVFENQLDLIAENAVLNSQHTGSNFKYRIDRIIGRTGGMTGTNVDALIKESAILGIHSIVLFSEGGEVFGARTRGEKTARGAATVAELKMINTAITKRDFEQKLFSHDIDKDEHIIALFIPFNYSVDGVSVDRIGVAAVTLEMKDIDRQMGYLYRQCLIIALLIVAIHGIFAFTVSKMLIFPLTNLIKATHSVSRGELEVRVPFVRDDEIGRLANSFNEMSVALQRMRAEDKGANPLSGLPGNITIARVIEESLDSGRIIAVLYCDLDNFKAYNDKYGFSKGDDAILYTRDCLIHGAGKEVPDNVFVGHQGGDDFVVVCNFALWESYVKMLLDSFDSGISRFYNRVDARNGYIDSVDRQGRPQRFPLMSISVAVVTNKKRAFSRHTDLIQAAAEVKKYAKSQQGSSYAVDRRMDYADGKASDNPSTDSKTPPDIGTLAGTETAPDKRREKVEAEISYRNIRKIEDPESRR